jgi:hypothetical protein
MSLANAHVLRLINYMPGTCQEGDAKMRRVIVIHDGIGMCFLGMRNVTATAAMLFSCSFFGESRTETSLLDNSFWLPVIFQLSTIFNKSFHLFKGVKRVKT